MPTPIVSGQKAAFIAIVNVVNPTEATERLPTLLVNYEDIPNAIGRQIDLFAGNNAYLSEAIAVFAANDSDLMAAGIYVGKTSSSLLTDPLLIINSSYTGGVSLTSNSKGLGILGSSSVNLLTLGIQKELDYLYMGSGSKLSALDSSASGAVVKNIIMSFAYSLPSEITAVIFKSNIGVIRISDGSVFGDEINTNPALTCTNPVSGLAAGSITHNTIKLTWTPPSGAYLLLDIFYRKLNSGVWIKADMDMGDFISNTGFIFRNLESETKYEFKVVTTCVNGATDAPSAITAITTCCE